MKYYKLQVDGFIGGGGVYYNLIGTILDENGKPVYNIDSDTLKKAEHIMADNVPLLAADGVNIELKTQNLPPEGLSRMKTIDDFDITFTVGEEDVSKVAAVRINREAAEKLYNELEQKLYKRS